MDTLPLPSSPNLEQYKKQAKDLLKATKSGDDDAVHTWGIEWLDALSRLTDNEVTPFAKASFDRAIGAIEEFVREKQDKSDNDGISLADAQVLIARAHSFENWSAFARHLEQVASGQSEDHLFESAADAIVQGDLPTLQKLLSQSPALIEAQSTRTHRATLLHYVAANGVEDFRQRTPANAVEIARFILEAGAEVDALAETYGGGKAQTTMNLLVSSAHPAAAGLMGSLAGVLLEHGAAINGLQDDGSPLMTALSFGYIDAAEMLVNKGGRVDNIVAAAALGRVDNVSRFLNEEGDVEKSITNVWWMPKEGQKRIELALVWASSFGRTEIVKFMLGRGVNPGSSNKDSMTALHLASTQGHTDIIRLLLDQGAPLEVKNRWGGTVLSTTIFFAYNHAVTGVDYTEIVELLLARGADISATRYPEGDSPLDEVVRRYHDAAK
jgi:hypothetical protein